MNFIAPCTSADRQNPAPLLRLVDEIEPGVPLSMAAGERDLAVITKAGAFGNDATMAVCRAVFSQVVTASRGVTPDHRSIGV